MPDKNITAIMIAAQPTKKEYVIGFSSLDLDGGLLNIVYEDSSFDQIPLSGDMEYAVDNSQIGPAAVSVKYKGFSTAFTITVREPRLKKVTIIAPPQKTAYAEGEMIDLTGLRLMGHYDNGETKEITDIPILEHKAKMGEAVIPLSIGGLLIPILVRISPAKAQSLELIGLPRKNSFACGEPLDLAGCSILVKYSDNREEVISITKAQVSGYNPDKPGKQILTISYGEKTCELSVEVLPDVPEKLEITRLPNKRVYVEGEKYSIKGIEITASGKGKSWAIPYSKIDFPSQYSKLGETSFSIHYDGQQLIVPVTVTKKRLKSISIETLPVKTEYKEGLDPLDMTGCTLKLFYNNGDAEVIPATNNMVKNYDNTNPQNIDLLIEYQGVQAKCPIAIIPKRLTGITISTPPKKVSYITGEMFDPEGMEVTAFYDNGGAAIIERYILSKNLPLTTEDTVITVTYLDMTAVVSISVSDPELEQTNSVEQKEPKSLQVIDRPPKIELPKAPIFYPPTFSLRFSDEEN